MDVDMIMRDLRRRFPLTKRRRGNGTALSRVDPDPFRILISTIISARTKDDTTVAVSERLFSRFSSPAELASADPSEVERLISGSTGTKRGG